MKRAKLIFILLSVISFVVMFTRCIETIDLPVNQEEVRFLVVDGFLNTANGKVDLKLQRATLINDAQTPFEAGAQVSLEDSEGNLYPLAEQGLGHYTGSTPALEVGKQYRLYIQTANGKEYRSVFATIKPTPVIDSIGWRADADGTQIIVDTHDATNQTRYYRWSFEETWEYHSRYVSWFRFSDVDIDTIFFDEVVSRAPWEMINVCYRTASSTKILTTTTAALSADIVNDYELQFLPQGTEKLGYRYSILVKQYAISKETYDYLEKLKKTSQDLGGLHAPQPSKVTGNVTSISDPSEVVLGYFDVGYAVEKRIIVVPQDLPEHLRQMNEPGLICPIDTIKVENVGMLRGSRTHTLLEYMVDESQTPFAFTYTLSECADCRLKGGVTLKPDFWP